METFEIQSLSFTYPEREAKAIDNLTMTVGRGDFIVLCGPSGCGKSTLLRQLKTSLAPHGRKEGEILFEGRRLEELDHREQSMKIGFVQQSVDNQIVTDKVWHEMAFGLESLGCDNSYIRRKVAETAAFFGIESWFYKDVADLSGGQKQLLNLASIMAMSPSVLILDEPTSQLDPIAASDFLAVLGKINRELGTTVILTEHRLEEAFSLASKVAVMDKGALVCEGSPGEVGNMLKSKGHGMFLAMPTAMRVWAGAEAEGECPVTVRDGRKWLAERAIETGLKPIPEKHMAQMSDQFVLKADEVWFRYEKETPDVVKGLSLELRKGEFMAILGGNGVGKSTTLKLLSGSRKPYRGSISAIGKIGVLPQDPQTLFVKKTVREDLFEIVQSSCSDEEGRISTVSQIVRLCRLEELLDRHPYDLSGGEQQRAALAKVLLQMPDILLLDEPTKGLDAEFKKSFASILYVLLKKGMSVLMISHDIEFCARYTHKCAMFFDGSIVAMAPPRDFFANNNFYTTSANRMARGIIDEAVTPEDLIFACGGKPEEEFLLPSNNYAIPRSCAGSPNDKPLPLPWWRKILAAVSGGVSTILFGQALGVADLFSMIDEGGITSLAQNQLRLYGAMIISMLIFAFSVSRRAKRPGYIEETPLEKRKLSGRTATAAVLILLFIPLTLFIGETYLDGRKYYIISLFIMLQCMIPFFLVFESRRPQARELIVIAVLCAIAVAGRTALFMLPEFKPVMAVTIIAGVAFGGETGFLVGSVTMLVSNMMFSQGPWTPWQMFCMGIIGFIAGVLFRKGVLRRTRISLSVFGALAAIIVYGGIMNFASAIMWVSDISWEVLLPYYITGFPIDCIHGAATALFLWFISEPMLEKLDRIKIKYGLVEYRKD